MQTHEPDCRDMELLLQADLDGELDAAATAALTRHVMQCAHCAELQQRLLKLHRMLRDNTLREKPSTEFSNALRHRLAAAQNSSNVIELRKNLSQQDSSTEQNLSAQGNSSQPSNASSKWKNSGLFAAGAALAASLMLTLTPALQSSLTMNSMDDNIVAEHVQSLQADHLLDVVSNDHHTVKPWFNGKLDFVPPVADFADSGFPLAGGRLAYLSGRNVAALVYRHGAHPINVFVWPSISSTNSAAECKLKSGYHICSWQKDAMNFWAVSDVGADEMQQFVKLWL